MTDEFVIEALVAADASEKSLSRHRDDADTAAQSHRSGSKFVREEEKPYVQRAKRNGRIVDLPETDETRQFKVLRRWYQ
jgi:hypothetical protein